jgi:hypothetical protein
MANDRLFGTITDRGDSCRRKQKRVAFKNFSIQVPGAMCPSFTLSRNFTRRYDRQERRWGDLTKFLPLDIDLIAEL